MEMDADGSSCSILDLDNNLRSITQMCPFVTDASIM